MLCYVSQPKIDWTVFQKGHRRRWLLHLENCAFSCRMPKWPFKSIIVNFSQRPNPQNILWPFQWYKFLICRYLDSCLVILIIVSLKIYLFTLPIPQLLCFPEKWRKIHELWTDLKIDFAKYFLGQGIITLFLCIKSDYDFISFIDEKCSRKELSSHLFGPQ